MPKTAILNAAPGDRREVAAHSRGAVLDEAHVGDIHGAFGSIGANDHAPRLTLWSKIKTLLAIIGPGLIVMVGDNDAGAFGTYTHLRYFESLSRPVEPIGRDAV